MPKRQAARERAQATVDAAAANVQPSQAMMERDEGLWIYVSPGRGEALKMLAECRTPDAIVADLIDDYLRKNRV
jgi:hypothetical protein